MIAIIDYNCGNLRSIVAACEKVGLRAMLVSEPGAYPIPDAIILPGVGSFGPAMKALHERGLVEPIKRHVADGTPLLGICLGMQLLMDGSEEADGVEGLGLIRGNCGRLPDDKPIPHIGWMPVSPRADWAGTPLESTAPGTPFYFAHSYNVRAPAENWLASAPFGEANYCAAIRKGNVFGLQFHPEKSGEAGLGVLRQLRRMVEGRVAA